MRTHLFRLALISAALASVSQFAAADDTLYVSPSLKLWSNTWNSWDVLPAEANFQSSIENYSSGSKVAVIPGIAVKYGDFSVGGSFMSNTSYGFTGPSGSISADRKETDITAGYSLLPTLSVNLGYKTVKQSFKGLTGSADYKYTGPFLGLAGSAALGNGFNLFGSVGVGRLDAKLPSYLASPSALSANSYKSDYRLSEIGVSYLLTGAQLPPAVKAVTFTLGYRAQVLDTDVTLPRGAYTSTAYIPRSSKARDNTEGLTAGLVAVF